MVKPELRLISFLFAKIPNNIRGFRVLVVEQKSFAIVLNKEKTPVTFDPISGFLFFRLIELLNMAETQYDAENPFESEEVFLFVLITFLRLLNRMLRGQINPRLQHLHTPQQATTTLMHQTISDLNW